MAEQPPGAIEAVVNAADTSEGVFTRRQYMVRRLMLDGDSMWQVIDAVALYATRHPGINMDAEKTWDEWEAIRLRGKPRWTQRGVIGE